MHGITPENYIPLIPDGLKESEWYERSSVDYGNRIYDLASDVNPLDHGGLYFRWDNGSFDVWDLHCFDPYSETDGLIMGVKYKYLLTEYRIDRDDLWSDTGNRSIIPALYCCGYKTYEYADLPELERLRCAVGYGLGYTGSTPGNNVNRLLGFNPMTRKRFIED